METGLYAGDVGIAGCYVVGNEGMAQNMCICQYTTMGGLLKSQGLFR